MLNFFIVYYFMARAWPKFFRNSLFELLLESYTVLKADIEYFSDSFKKLDIAQRVWKKCKCINPGSPCRAENEYDKVLDTYAVERRYPFVAHLYITGCKPSSHLTLLASGGCCI
jgi:hypothetical protein